jgi:type 2 lantibiotic biosynthesis protein LanM
MPILARAGTDRMALEQGRLRFGRGAHRPSLAGAGVDAAGYAESIARGFSQMYRLVRDRRAELLAPGGPIEWFACDAVRVILQSTQTYATLLATSLHPDLLHDAHDRELLIDRLWSIARPGLERAVPAECEDVQRGDIPVFTASPASRNLRSSSGTCIEGILPEPSIETVRRRIASMSESDLAAQLWFVRASLGTATYAAAPDRRPSSASQPHRERLIGAALRIAERLEERAVHGDAGTTWIGASAIDERRGIEIAPLGPDLYDGLPGVALFLAQVGAVTGERRYERLARRSLETLRSQIARGAVNGIGALCGWGGIIYALAHLGDLWFEPALLDEAAAYAERAAALIDADRTFDVVGGAAGCIIAVLALHARAPGESLCRIARRCGAHLIANRRRCANGAGWVAAETGDVPLTGLSHGAAGIALALLRLSAATSDPRFHAVAREAIAYERSLFSESAQNWPDLRAAAGTPDGRTFRTLWCHGAPGIGIARLASAPFLNGALVDAEIEIAVRTTCRDGFRGGDSLCHGALGNLELLLVAAERSESAALKMRVNELSALAIDESERNGWRCGNPGGIETPGLMTGIAGIGFQLLRLAGPAEVPSILSFDEPRNSTFSTRVAASTGSASGTGWRG